MANDKERNAIATARRAKKAPFAKLSQKRINDHLCARLEFVTAK
jgi:hypothetical protein